MVGLVRYLKMNFEKNPKEKGEHPALSAILVLTISAGLAAGINSFVEGEIENISKGLYSSEIYRKADKDTNKIISYKESYDLGKELNVIKETNLCPLTSFNSVLKRASPKDITNYLKN